MFHLLKKTSLQIGSVKPIHISRPQQLERLASPLLALVFFVLKTKYKATQQQPSRKGRTKGLSQTLHPLLGLLLPQGRSLPSNMSQSRQRDLKKIKV